ncbi:unnamed protein product [Rotaria socialis]|uniref:Uncharacterized protein n=1 Tax=Rotaria socialis TaxID=392032 RepID=A0A818F4P0_9BILA|nr:unnamed protein product [Rotaria socialis]
MTKSATELIALAVLSTLLVFMPDQTEAGYCRQLCLKHGYLHGIQIYARCLCCHKMERDKRNSTSTAAAAAVEVWNAHTGHLHIPVKNLAD